MTSQGNVYSQFKRALARRNFIEAWTLASELPKVSLVDGLALLLLARDLEPARFERGASRWHARLCMERPLPTRESQLALAALVALPTDAAETGAQSLAAVCERHGLTAETELLHDWLDRRAANPARCAGRGRASPSP